MSDIEEHKQDYKENTTLWFGKYKGVPLKDVPSDYLKWVKTTDTWDKMSKSLKKAIGSNIEHEPTEKQKELLERIMKKHETLKEISRLKSEKYE